MAHFVSFPHKISDFPKKVQKEIIDKCKGQPDGYVQVGPEKFILTASFKAFADTIYNFEARRDDVFICTHPRSGTTWTQEIVWLICNGLDYETARNVVLNKRVPYLDYLLHRRHLWVNDSNVNSSLLSNTNFKGLCDPKYKELSEQTTRRFIKTHIPIQLQPWNLSKVGAKIVYVARNPKDVAVSYYYLNTAHPFIRFDGDFEEFIDFFMNDLTLFGPYWKHVLDGWSHRNDENVYFMFYEDLKLDTASTLKKLSTFLGQPINDDALPAFMDHINIENFKRNPSVNYQMSDSNNGGLVRRGKVGGNLEMSKEITKKFDEWIEENLKDSDLRFPHCNDILKF